ncbi:hypothetical protein JW905_00845, partial [bacterium]|nr:hypothetical protein [candidate division CSSED10-310 bacterium]
MITKKTPWPALILCFICSAICAAGLLAATGDDCNDPIIIDIPGDLPYADTDQSTCGRGNNYSNTCLGEYDGGEDIIYELTLDVGSYIEITLDPGPSTWTGIAIDDSCPLAPTTCIAESTISTATVHGIECSYFDAGTYYIMIDTFPSPTCIPTFTLTITECVAPVGACCVETDCVANTTNSECINIYGGEWHSGEDCATFTCPASIGESSDLATAIAGLPYSANFDNDLSSADGPGGTCDKYAPVTIMQNDVWFVWTAGENCVATATLTSSYDAIMTIRDDCVELAELECADDAVAAGVEEIVFCASNGTTYYFQVGDTGSAEGGGNNLFELVCEPATVGACCFSDGSCSEMDQLDCIAASGDFQGTGTTCDPNPCSQPVPGDTCLLPIQVSIPGDLPFTDLDQYTCGRTDDYDETCLGYYDGGEDIIYELNVTVAIVVSISMDPRGTSYTGLAVDDGCPPDATCMAVHTNPGGSVHGISNLSLSPGMYYLIIDTWAAPDCVPEFDLTIGTYVPPTGACCQEDGSCSVEIPGDCSVMGGIYQGDDSVCDPNPCSIPEIGDNCSVPIQVGSADLPFTDVAQTNCGRINKYNDTCLGDYDGGEDIIYELALDADTWIEITLDSGTTAYTGIALDDSCPLDTVACIAKSTLIGAGVHGIDC